jgi:hypothetical protein
MSISAYAIEMPSGGQTSFLRACAPLRGVVGAGMSRKVALVQPRAAMTHERRQLRHVPPHYDHYSSPVRMRLPWQLR